MRSHRITQDIYSFSPWFSSRIAIELFPCAVAAQLLTKMKCAVSQQYR